MSVTGDDMFGHPLPLPGPSRGAKRPAPPPVPSPALPPGAEWQPREVGTPPADMVRDHGGPQMPTASITEIPPPVLAARAGWAFLVHSLTYTRGHWLWLMHPPESVGEMWRLEGVPRRTAEEMRTFVLSAEHGDTFLVAGCTVMAIDYTKIQGHAEEFRSMGGRPANPKPGFGRR